MMRRIALFFLLPLSVVMAEEPQSNGAVHGLLPPLMEFQFAARMEGKTLLQIGEDVVRQGKTSLATKAAIADGVAKGMKVTGEADNLETWKIQGLERKIGPIRTHIHRIAKAAEETEKFSAVQKQALNTWLDQFSKADEACKKEPSITNLDALSDQLLSNVASVFESIDRPEVALLEAVLEASTVQRRLRKVGVYIDQILALHKARDERAEQYSLAIDGLAISPGAILYGIKERKPLAGLKKRYGDWLGRIIARLKVVEKTSGLFLLHAEPIGKLIQDLKTNQQSLDDGSLERFRETISLMARVETLLHSSEPLAPAALRIVVSVYAYNQQNLFSLLQEKIAEDAVPGKTEFAYTFGGVKIKVAQKASEPEITLEADGRVASQLGAVLRLAEQTLKQSRMGDADRKVLTDAIEAARLSKASLGKPTPYRKWATWSNAINDVRSLYRF